MWTVKTAAVSAIVALATSAMALSFTPEERASLLQYWNADGRYSAAPTVDPTGQSLFQVRWTVAGSKWLWNYNRARGLSKGPPTQSPLPITDEQKSWEAWLDKRMERDRWLAQCQCESWNNRFRTGPSTSSTIASLVNPPDPGSIPDGLIAFAGNPPRFYAPAIPLRYTIAFDDGVTISYTDNPPMRHKFAYYRYDGGVMLAGQKVRDIAPDVVETLFNDAGVTPSERRVMQAVSMLEGGFESVNTYDTGFVSVGFIQFACLSDGSGSLGKLLLRYKSEFPDSFSADFRKYGIDVDADAKLVVVDPMTGAELVGADAAMKVIDDKRLIAVFQRAGQVSRSFRIAQIRSAKADYYPADDDVTITGGTIVLTGKVKDFIKSEAGMATLMDRKVNTGKIDALILAAQKIVVENNLRSINDLAEYEADLIEAVRFRKDYLLDNLLSKPVASKTTRDDRTGTKGSRGGDRGGKTGGGTGGGGTGGKTGGGLN